MSIMSCVCGYSVDDGQHMVETPIYFQSGKRKGEVKVLEVNWLILNLTKLDS